MADDTSSQTTLKVDIIETLLRQDPDASQLARLKKDTRWSQKRHNAYQWIKKHLMTRQGTGLDFETVAVFLENVKTTDELHYIKRLLELLPLTLRESLDFTPFRSYDQTLGAVATKIEDNINQIKENRHDRLWNAKERENYMSKTDLITKLRAWLQTNRKTLFEGSGDTPLILKQRRVALILCLNLLNGPCRRREYMWLQSQYDEEINGDQNFVSDTDMILQRYKTSDIYGAFVKPIIDFNTIELIRLIVHSQAWRTEHQRQNPESRYHIFSATFEYTTQIQNAFEILTDGLCKNLSTNLLRKIDVEHYYRLGDLYYPAGQRWLASQHGHSVRTQMEHYFRTNPSTVKAIVEQTPVSENDGDAADSHASEFSASRHIDTEQNFTDQTAQLQSQRTIPQQAPDQDDLMLRETPKLVDDDSDEKEEWLFRERQGQRARSPSIDIFEEPYITVISSSDHSSTSESTSTAEEDEEEIPEADLERNVGPGKLTLLQTQALWSLGPKYKERKKVNWRTEVYGLTTEFKGQAIGDIIRTIGADMDGPSRAKKLNYHTRLMSSWNNEDNIAQFVGKMRDNAGANYKRRRSD